ncbi:hypothetical protein CERZMDRAFT_92196 [Cercospora zeae-maydis SCOH1-5]|uniref:Uncharacterized protein n=1 Tax=Cercospora zeae-maydis SCOH1-5 TaxID=717836 RepID=A0A6A6FVQ0_9PEZI|nr:hypothetical protein CERZMDRAFT_92196 [Cercospora zeae-maydis SCOH1-5]
MHYHPCLGDCRELFPRTAGLAEYWERIFLEREVVCDGKIRGPAYSIDDAMRNILSSSQYKPFHKTMIEGTVALMKSMEEEQIEEEEEKQCTEHEQFMEMEIAEVEDLDEAEDIDEADDIDEMGTLDDAGEY